MHDLGPLLACCAHGYCQRVSIALQRSLAHAKHARTLRLEQFTALLPPPPPHVPLTSSELHIVASFGEYDRLTYLSFFMYMQFLYRHVLVIRWGSRRFQNYTIRFPGILLLVS